jgi:hypothetical protein
MKRRVFKAAVSNLSWVLGAIAAVSCGGAKFPGKDGYRAIAELPDGRKLEVAARGPLRRLAEPGGPVTIVDLSRARAYRVSPTRKTYTELVWTAGDALIADFPLGIPFDAGAYARSHEAGFRRGSDEVVGIHPCATYEFAVPSGDTLQAAVARDLQNMLVRVERERPDTSGNLQVVATTQLVDIRPGATETVFTIPKGYVRADAPKSARERRNP